MSTAKTQKVKASVLVYADQLPSQMANDSPCEPQVYALKDDNSFIIGSDPTCRIQLNNEHVAPKHAMLRMSDGDVIVSDWYSDAGTMINGRRISEPTPIRMMDRLEIGPYRLRVVVHARHENRETIADFPEFVGEADTAKLMAEHNGESDESSTADVSTTPTVSASGLRSESAEESYTREFAQRQGTTDQGIGNQALAQDQEETVQAENNLQASQSNENADAMTQISEATFESQPVSGSGTDLQKELAAANLQIEQLEKELEYQLSIQEADEDDGEFGDEEKELLRDEVIHLQTELAQREQEINDLTEGGLEHGVTEPAETAKLIERLEELLDELQSTDQRVLGLEDMLRIADEACQAEKESHCQIEEWITELEKRVVARDEEWQAREEQLQTQLKTAKERRPERAPLKSRELRDSTQANQKNLESQVETLESLNGELEKQLEVSQAEVGRLNRLIEKAGSSEAEINELVGTKQQLREKELELTEKTADLNRHRVELTKMREELDEMAAEIRPAESDSTNLKLREFRNHLREIHEEKKQEKQEKSLSTRLSRLWNRLERR